MQRLILLLCIVLVGLVGIAVCQDFRPRYQSPSVPYRAPTYINVTPTVYLPVWSDGKVYHFKDGASIVVLPNTTDDRYEPVHLFERNNYFSRYPWKQKRPIPKPVESTRTYKPAKPSVPVQIED